MQCLRDKLMYWILDNQAHHKNDLHVGGDKLPLMALHFQGQKVSYPLLSLGVEVNVLMQ